jgi:hypothetical protein
VSISSRHYQAVRLIYCFSAGSFFYNTLEDFGNDHQSPEDADESGLGGFWAPTPDILAAHSSEMLNQPSVEFIRQMWWQSLVRYYGGPRALAPHRIVGDLTHLLVLLVPISFIWAEVFLALEFPSLQFLNCIVRCLLHPIWRTYG